MEESSGADGKENKASHTADVERVVRGQDEAAPSPLKSASISDVSSAPSSPGSQVSPSEDEADADYGYWPFGKGTPGSRGPPGGKLRQYTSPHRPISGTMSIPPQNERVRQELLIYMKACNMTPPPPEQLRRRPASQQSTRGKRSAIQLEEVTAESIAFALATGDSSPSGAPTPQPWSPTAPQRAQRVPKPLLSPGNLDGSRQSQVSLGGGSSKQTSMRKSSAAKLSVSGHGKFVERRKGLKETPSIQHVAKGLLIDAHIQHVAKGLRNQSAETRVCVGSRNDEDLSDLVQCHSAPSRRMLPSQGKEHTAAKQMRELCDNLFISQGGKKQTKKQVKEQAAVVALKEEVPGLRDFVASYFSKSAPSLLKGSSNENHSASKDSAKAGDEPLAPFAPTVKVLPPDGAAAETPAQFSLQSLKDCYRQSVAILEADLSGTRHSEGQFSKSTEQAAGKAGSDSPANANVTPSRRGSGAGFDVTLLGDASLQSSGVYSRPRAHSAAGRRPQSQQSRARPEKLDADRLNFLAKKALTCTNPHRMQQFAELAKVSTFTGRPRSCGGSCRAAPVAETGPLKPLWA